MHNKEAYRNGIEIIEIKVLSTKYKPLDSTDQMDRSGDRGLVLLIVTLRPSLLYFGGLIYYE